MVGSRPIEMSGEDVGKGEGRGAMGSAMLVAFGTGVGQHPICDRETSPSSLKNGSQPMASRMLPTKNKVADRLGSEAVGRVAGRLCPSRCGSLLHGLATPAGRMLMAASVSSRGILGGFPLELEEGSRQSRRLGTAVPHSRNLVVKEPTHK